MSHFSVLVIGPGVEGQLAMYDENSEVEAHPEPYLHADMTRMLEHYRTKDVESGKLGESPAVAAKIGDDGRVTGVTHAELQDMFSDWMGGEIRLADEPGDDFAYERWTTGNPNSKWDWYQVGGRWTGYFKLKPGKTGKTGEPGLMTDPPAEGLADQAVKRDIDIEGMRDDAGAKAGERWHKFHAIVNQHPAFEPFSTFRERLANIDDAREAYHAQPAIVALGVAEFLGFFDSPETYMVSLADFVQAARDSALSSYAFVRGGEWYQKGDMGWFGMSHNEQSEDEWNQQFNKMLDELPGNTLLTCVDCHI